MNNDKKEVMRSIHSYKEPRLVHKLDDDRQNIVCKVKQNLITSSKYAVLYIFLCTPPETDRCAVYKW